MSNSLIFTRYLEKNTQVFRISADKYTNPKKFRLIRRRMENRLDLPYAQILLLRPHIAELVIFDGVELTAEMVREYQLILRERFSSPFGLLINKGNHYTYSFDAQMELGLDKTMKATAVLVERESSELIMRSIKNLPDHTEWNMNVFYEREHAIAWLEKQLQD